MLCLLVVRYSLLDHRSMSITRYYGHKATTPLFERGKQISQIPDPIWEGLGIGWTWPWTWLRCYTM